MTMVLEGIRVLDLSRHIAGPYCGLLLADAGAEVIRMERPGGDDDRRIGPLAPGGDSYAFIARGRNSKGITLNLSSDGGRGILRELVRVSDVLLENFGLRDKRALGLDYATLREINPGIILASVSAFGLDGPYAQRLGFDPIAQGISGAMSFTGFPENPPTRSAAAWSDFATATHAALGVMFALWHRQRTGRGQAVDACLLDSAACLVALHGIYGEYKKLGIERRQLGNASPYAFADTFLARDGWVFISCTRDRIWHRFVRVLGREELASDPRFKTDWDRARNRQLISDIVAPWVAERSVEEIAALLEAAQVPCGRINSIPEAATDGHLAARGMLAEVEHPEAGMVPVAGVVLKLSETPGSIRRAAPLVGEHNEEIYGELLGYPPGELARLNEEGVI